jgi:hypothetical protein
MQCAVIKVVACFNIGHKKTPELLAQEFFYDITMKIKR